MISSSEQPRAIEAFLATRATVCTGIGLFEAKEFIEGHGGEIGIESRNSGLEHGTGVRLFLPLITPYGR
jgi:signal transduction histidine kinase